MQDPKRLAWTYVIVGIVAVVAAGWFLYLDTVGADHSFAVFDWAFLALGGVAVFRGIQRFVALRKQGGTDKS